MLGAVVLGSIGFVLGFLVAKVGIPSFVVTLAGFLAFQGVVLLLMNILFVPVFVSALRIPFAILQPLILVFCFVGVYSTSSSMLDMWVMLVFGVIGYVMKKHDYPPAPLVLALVLGNGLEMSLRQSLMISQGNPGILFARPISGTIMVAVLLVVGWPLIRRLWVRRPRAPRAADPA